MYFVEGVETSLKNVNLRNFWSQHDSSDDNDDDVMEEDVGECDTSQVTSSVLVAKEALFVVPGSAVLEEGDAFFNARKDDVADRWREKREELVEV